MPALNKIAPRFGVVIVALLAGWLMLPVLTPAHVEGFSAAVAALGVHWAQGTLATFDQLEPLNTEYFGLTKLGLVMGIGGLTTALHVSADLAFRLIMWGGLAMLLASSIWLIRRWSNAGWAIAAAPLIVLPGVIESGFVYCDNVLSAGLSGCALCLLYQRRIVSTALAGMLFAFAVLTRTDTVLIAVAMPVILVELYGWSRRALVMLLALALPGAIVLFGALASLGASPVDVVRVGAAAVAAWDRSAAASTPIGMLAYFLGLGGVVLIGLGLVTVLRQKQWLPIVRLIVPPVILILILRNSLWQTRQLLALTPFLGALAAIGWREASGAHGSRVIRALVIGLVAMSLVGPRWGAGFADGPRVFTGRAWNIPAVRRWQSGSRGDVVALDRLVTETAGQPSTTLIADGWDRDRYLHLLYLDRGYRLTPRDALPASCRRAADHYQRGAIQLVIVRNYQSYVPYAQGLTAERFEQRSRPCIAALGGPLILVTDKVFADRLGTPTGRTLDDRRAEADIYNLTYRQISGPGQLAALSAAYRQDEVDYRARAGVARNTMLAGKTIADGEAATRSRTGLFAPQR